MREVIAKTQMAHRLASMLCAFTVLLLVACGRGNSGQVAEPGLTLEPCRLEGGALAECGKLTVYEDRTAQTGRTIDLNIVVFPATGSSSVVADDPLFLLAGGPGQAATQAYAQALYLFDDINRTRDIVLVDQRGSGDSNGLPCENLEDESLPADLPDAEVVGLLDTCRQELAGRADLSLYTTDVFVEDLDDVREALGYEQVNLYGASYGTRAALTYMRRYPERVRSAVLDAVVGPELVLFLQMPRDAQRALDLLFERCAADDACRTAFPDVQQEYQELLTRLDEPQSVTVANPLTNEPITFELTADRLSQYVFNILYSAEFQSLLPLLIHHARETGDFAPLVVQALAVGESAGLDPGLLYAVTCSEDAPLIDPDAAAALQADTDFPLFAERFLAICAEWPRTTIAADFRAPLRSEIPVLLLSGEADPVTPPEYAAAVAAGLSNSRHLILPGFGHGVVAAGCMPKVVAAFIASADPAAPDTSCLDELRPPPFFTSFAGPEP